MAGMCLLLGCSWGGVRQKTLWVRQTLILWACSGLRAHSGFKAHFGLRAHAGFRQTLNFRAHSDFRAYSGFRARSVVHVCPENVPVVTPVRPAAAAGTVLCLLHKLQRWAMLSAGAKIEACAVKALIESMSAM